MFPKKFILPMQGVLLVAAIGCNDVVSPIMIAPVPSASFGYTTGQTSVAAGYDRTCAVRASGVLQCWTVNTNGQGPPERSASSGSYVQAAIGTFHTCALVSDGSIDCFGYNTMGEGLPHTAASGSFVEVAAGSSSTCALRDDGVVQCWGQLPGGTIPAVKSAANGGSFVQVVMARSSMCGLRSDGQVECWGVNSSNNALPALVPSVGAFTQIATSSDHVCGLLQNGTIECVGMFAVTMTPSTGSFVKVAAGGAYTCGLLANGSIECAGSNWAGQAPPQRTPPAGVTYDDIAAGEYQTCAVRSDQLIECFGDNSLGEGISDQRIDFAGAPPVSPHGYVPAATSTAGLTVDVLDLTPTICTFVAGAIDETKPGTCVLQAANGGSDLFRADTTLQSFSVGYSIPNAPSALAGSANGSTQTLSWLDHSNVETQFQLQRRTRNGDGTWSSYVLVAVAAPDAASFDDATVTGGLQYQYRVRSCTPAGCSPWNTSATMFHVTTVPLAPAPFAATVTSSTHIDLAWSSVSGNETRFEVLRRMRADAAGWGAWLYLTTTVASATSFANDVATNAQYEYRIRGCNSAGCSPYSTSAIVTPQVVPQAPTGFSAVAAGGPLINLTWTDASSNESRFRIQKRSRAGVWQPWIWLPDAAADATAQQDTAVTAATAYQYRIRSCNAAGCSAVVAVVVTTP